MRSERECGREDSSSDCWGLSHESPVRIPRRGPSAHIVIQCLAAALTLHVHEDALSGAELLVETHHVVHAGERLTVDVADHVALAQAELLVQASRLDPS